VDYKNTTETPGISEIISTLLETVSETRLSMDLKLSSCDKTLSDNSKTTQNRNRTILTRKHPQTTNPNPQQDQKISWIQKTIDLLKHDKYN